jgi:hypothetical protein
MQRIEKLSFESGESHIHNLIDNAWRIMGGASVPADQPDAKPFRRIRGNDFTERDIADAVTILIKRVQDTLSEAKTGLCPYPEVEGIGTNVEDTWRAGLIANARLALRELDTFLQRTNHALSEAGHAPLSKDILAAVDEAN